MNNEIQEIRYQVGEAWKGTYNAATTYGNANVVQDTTGLSVYRSLKPGNVGHPLTDTAWWFLIIDLSSIKEESDRIKALNDAIAADEAQRVENENGRVTAEQGRVDAENARVTAEQGRVTAEQQRVSAEQQRASQEQIRISQEQSRVTAEQGRVAAEAQRVQKEQLRENNEAQRVINETNRVAAEAERVAQYAADHQQAVADHDQYVDSLGAFDISAYHATGGVLAKYADLTAALGTGGANIPEAIRKGGMSVKFVQSSDNKYVQYRLTSDTFTTTVSAWQKQGAEVTVSQNTQTGNFEFEIGNSTANLASEANVETDKYELGAFERVIQSSVGQAVNPADSVLRVSIKSGEEFTVKFVGDTTKARKVTSLYTCDVDGGNRTSIASNININDVVKLTASDDINNLCVYIDSSIVLGTQDIAFICHNKLALSVDVLKNTADILNRKQLELISDIGKYQKSLALTQGQDVYSANSVFPASIKSGEKFSVYVQGDVTKVGRIMSLYSCDEDGGNAVTLKSPVQLNTENVLVATTDIHYLSMYIVGTEIHSNTDIVVLCKTNIIYNSEQVPIIKDTVERIEPIVDELDKNINGQIIDTEFNGTFDNNGFYIAALPESFQVKVGNIVKVLLDNLTNIDGHTYVYLMNNNNALSQGVAADSVVYLTAHTTGIVNGIRFYKATSAGLTLSGEITIPVKDGLLSDYKNFNVIDDAIVQPLTSIGSLQDFMFDTPFENVNENDRFVLNIESLDNPIWAYLIYATDKTKNQVYHNIIVTPGKYVFEGFFGNTVWGLRIYCPRTSTAELSFTLTRLNIKDRMQSEINELSGDVVPVYYRRPATLVDETTVSDYLYEKSKTIQNAIADAMPNGDAFILITDIHDDNGQNQMKSPMLIGFLQKNCNIPRLFNDGDDGGGVILEVNQKLRNAMSSNKVYTASGNHDYMLQATYGDVFYSQNMFAENAVFGSDNKNYFYVDNPQQKIRYIILSTYGTENGNVIEIMGDTHFDEAQFTWFVAALSAPSDYSIIVFTHHFYGTNTDESVSLDDGEKRYVDAINSHNSVSDEKVIAVFCGHCHRDRIINLSSEQAVYQSDERDNTTVPCIITTCDKNVPYAGIINDMNITDRQAGTIREQAFDVVVISKTNKTIKCIRIGCEALNGIGGSPNRTAEQNSGEPVEIREVVYP